MERKFRQEAGAVVGKGAEAAAGKTAAGAGATASERIAATAAAATSKGANAATITERAASRRVAMVAKEATKATVRRREESIIERYRTKIFKINNKFIQFLEKTRNRITNGGIGRIARSGGSSSARRTADRALLEKAAAKNAAGHQIGRDILLRRLGRGTLIIVPVIGGIFATYLFHADVCRMKEEKVKARYAADGGYVGGIGSRIRSRSMNNLMWSVFGCAACADGLDAICHFGIAYFVLVSSLSSSPSPSVGTAAVVEATPVAAATVSQLLLSQPNHEILLLLEQTSMVCAIASTVFAVGGEFLSHRSRTTTEETRNQQPDHRS